MLGRMNEKHRVPVRVRASLVARLTMQRVDREIGAGQPVQYNEATCRVAIVVRLQPVIRTIVFSKDVTRYGNDNF